MRKLSLRIKCTQKLISHSFSPHSFIPHSLSLFHIREISYSHWNDKISQQEYFFLKAPDLYFVTLTLVILRFSSLKSATREITNILKINSSSEKVLLESCCFLLDYHQEKIKRKRKRTWVQEIFKWIIEQGVYHNLLQEMRVNDRESHFRLFV